jgi:(p)ppGpp synthase/HD superfamily hydrolase
MPDIVEAARRFAVEQHAALDQRYGGEPYEVHLAHVVSVLTDVGADDELQAAGWLHDTVEDCGVTVGDLRAFFGARVVTIVHAVSGEGATRQERNAGIYARISACPEAAVVKVADRIANVEASPMGSRHADRYLSEAASFAEKVADLAPDNLRARLDAAYARLRSAETAA